MGYGLIIRILIFSFIFCFSIEAKSPSKEVQAAVAPYLLPDDHPIKSLLDTLFSSSRVLLNLDTLEEAGFKKAKPRKFTKLIVTKHSAFPGYIFKLYLDAQRHHKDMPEHHFWILRAQGAQKVRHAITNYGVEDLFKVPQKWIYALPEYPLPPSGYYTKYYILVEEDMHILSDRENKNLWASDYVTPELLKYLFKILKKVGLHDCAKPDNIPFSRDGRVSFIDTQTFDRSVDYDNLTPYLSSSNQAYWKHIIEE